MPTNLRLSVLARVAALVIAVSLIGCARSISPDDSYYLGTVPAVSVGVGVAG
jgi:ABC-type uncharacterized transport system auxiliary subunit